MCIDHLKYCVDVLGGQTPMAKAIGASQSHVWNWINRDKKVPADQVLAIVRSVWAAGGKIRPFDLRPDIYPDPEWMPGELVCRFHDTA